METIAPGILRIVLESPDGTALPIWHPGAHIEVETGRYNRHYSLCGTGPNKWEIAVALEDESRGGSEWLHKNVGEGTLLKVRGPRNNFRADANATHLVLVAGGVGITPMLAMADEAKRKGVKYELHYSGKAVEPWRTWNGL